MYHAFGRSSVGAIWKSGEGVETAWCVNDPSALGALSATASQGPCKFITSACSLGRDRSIKTGGGVPGEEEEKRI